jgi:octaprenyl-diphosphate synthase
VGHDIQEGKLTLPVLYACEADGQLRKLVQTKVGERAVSPDDARTILTATRATGGLDRARQKARALADAAGSELAVLPDSPFRAALADLATHAADRAF